MNWGSWGAFWAMGGQAWYVWGSYALMVLLMLAAAMAWARLSMAWGAQFMPSIAR